MTTLENNVSDGADAANATEISAPSQRPPLGLVMREPLGSMFKVERAPPPMTIAGTHTSSESSPQKIVTTSAVSNKSKLSKDRLMLNLSQLVLQFNDDMKHCDNPGAQAGFDEVCNFLAHCEHLRILQRN